jgi:hypothetical protein
MVSNFPDWYLLFFLLFLCCLVVQPRGPVPFSPFFLSFVLSLLFCSHESHSEDKRSGSRSWEGEPALKINH